jgi:hypothetical protein
MNSNRLTSVSLLILNNFSFLTIKLTSLMSWKMLIGQPKELSLKSKIKVNAVPAGHFLQLEDFKVSAK